MLMDELRGRNDAPVMGDASSSVIDLAHVETGATIAVVDNRGIIADRIQDALGGMHRVETLTDPGQTITLSQEAELDLIIVSFDLLDHDGLRLCSQLRSFERTRQIPILVVVDVEDQSRLMRALDMGVNDYLHRPLDKLELKARVNTQIKRKRYTDRLRFNVTRSMELAVTDPLTGLYNRRHMDNQLAVQVTNAASRGKAVAVLALDVDFFKPINDTHGHDVGDRVLQELATRLKAQVRAIDLCCRMGGEEFVVILPETDLQVGFTVAERLRRAIANKPFNAGAKQGPLAITVSIGVAGFESLTDTPQAILKRADDALYEAKRSGRNRVVSDAA
jgi:two-component system cell cycle response regulator